MPKATPPLATSRAGGFNAPPQTGAGIPQNVAATAGNNQTTNTSTTLAVALVVVVTDTFGNPVIGDPVTFTAVAGPLGGTGTFPGSLASVTVATDVTGTATAPALTANATADTFTVQVVEGVTGLSTTFTEVTVAAPAVPGVPTIGTLTQTGPNQVTIGWTFADARATTFDVAFHDTNSNFIVRYSNQPLTLGPPFTRVDTSLFPVGQTVKAHVNAGNTSGKSAFSSNSNTITIASTAQVPGSPTGLAAAVGPPQASGAAALSWVAPSSNGGAQISGYTWTVYASTDPGQTTPVTSGSTTGATGLSATATGLTNGTSYFFVVFATNSVGNGPVAVASSAFVPFTTPGTPTGVSAAGHQLSGTVSWTAPAAGGSAITSYTVNVYTAPSGGTQVAQITGISPTATSASVTGLAGNTTFYATVVAVNAAGSSAESSPRASFTTTLNAPTVTGVSPGSGAQAGGNTVTISGTNFDSSATVAFGGVAATAVTLLSLTSIQCTAPASATAQTVDVVVTTSGGISPTVQADQYTYTAPPSAPTVTGVSPGSGSAAGGTALTINGTGFFGGTGSADVSQIAIGGTTYGSGFTVVSDTQLTFTTVAHAGGTYHVTVTNHLGTSVKGLPNKDLFVFNPGITAVSPASGPAAGGTTVGITGVGLTGATAVKFGANNATTFTVNSDTSITAVAPAGTGGTTVDITVTTPAGTTNTVTQDQFTYQAAATPSQSVQRLAAFNTSAGRTPTHADCNIRDIIIVQPQQVAGFPISQSGSLSFAQMKNSATGNPDLVVCLYLNGTHAVPAVTNDNWATWLPGAPHFTPVDPGPNDQRSWYTYDSTGAHDNPPVGALMSPCSTGVDAAGHVGWFGYLAAVAKAAITFGFDGIFFDVLASNIEGITTAVDPRTGNTYVPNSRDVWVQDCADGGHRMFPIIGAAAANVCGNGLDNDTNYFGTSSGPGHVNPPGNSRIYEKPLYTLMMEQYFIQSGSNGSPTNFPNYANTIKAVDDATRVKGCFFWCIYKLWVTATALQIDQHSRLAIAMLLLGGQGYNSVAIQFETSANGGAGDWTHYPIFDAQLGDPTNKGAAGTLDANGIYTRALTNGMVLLNTGSAAATPVNTLPAGTWTDVGPTLAGSTGGNVYAGGTRPSVPANNALILKNY